MNDLDLFEEPVVPGGTRGGKRPGSGSKKGVNVKTMTPEETYKKYAEGRAKKEQYLGETTELEYRRKAGMLVPRDDVKRATATAYAHISQTLRGIPDTLERKLALPPEAIEAVGRLIDDAMDTLSVELEAMCEKSYA